MNIYYPTNITGDNKCCGVLHTCYNDADITLSLKNGKQISVCRSCMQELGLKNLKCLIENSGVENNNGR